MICRDARLAIGAEPHAVPPGLAEHLTGCAACSQFQREMIALEANIRRALAEAPLAARTRPQRRFSTWSGWALAASILVAVLSTLVIWTLRPAETLAREVITHVNGEPDSWSSSVPVAAPTLDGILRAAGVALDANSNSVVYARSCRFRGHDVPHLVVKTSHGPVTVLILRNVHVGAREAFHESGMTGVITPAPQGSIAVLGRGDANLDEVSEQMRRAVRWLPQNPHAIFP